MSQVGKALRVVASVPGLAMVGVIKVYQWTISPLLGPRCKYYPSCSNYGLVAIRRHGAVRGFALGAWRVLRCNPWSNGGIDDVPQPEEPLFRRGTFEASMGVTTPAAKKI